MSEPIQIAIEQIRVGDIVSVKWVWGDVSMTWEGPVFEVEPEVRGIHERLEQTHGQGGCHQLRNGRVHRAGGWQYIQPERIGLRGGVSGALRECKGNRGGGCSWWYAH